jgi:hypothetical protein
MFECCEGNIMQVYRIETTLKEQGVLMLSNLPFSRGERIEVIILNHSQIPPHAKVSSLHGTVLEYLEPTEPVAELDWEVMS